MSCSVFHLRFMLCLIPMYVSSLCDLFCYIIKLVYVKCEIALICVSLSEIVMSLYN